jgi:hypothetical protein
LSVKTSVFSGASDPFSTTASSSESSASSSSEFTKVHRNPGLWTKRWAKRLVPTRRREGNARRRFCIRACSHSKGDLRVEGVAFFAGVGTGCIRP